jgi:hypothetical protein
MQSSDGTTMFIEARAYWLARREAALNWLALGLLLAAWNAVDNDAGPAVRRRPEALRAYPCVSARAVRAVQLHSP